MSDTNELRAVKLTNRERLFLLDLEGYGPYWVGRKHPIANRMMERGLVFSDLVRGRQIRVGLTFDGSALLSTSDARAPSVEEGKHG